MGASDIGNFQQLPTLFRVAEGRDSQRYLKSVLGRGEWLVDLSDNQKTVLRTKNELSSNNHNFFGLDAVEIENIKVERFIGGNNIETKNQIFINQINGETGNYLTPEVAEKNIVFANPLAVSVHLPNQFNIAQLFDKTIMARKKKILLDMLRRIDSRLEDMHSISPDGEQRIYVELGGDSEALPLPQLGHGFSRLVYLYCSLLVTDAKLALVDEIENGIHYSSLPTLFHGIQDIAARHDVQTLMTTHSWDCIRAAYKTFADADSLQDFQLIRLERDGDNVRAVVINDEMLDTVMEAGYEVR